MKLYYVTTDNSGVNIDGIKTDPLRLVEAKGGKYVVMGISSSEHGTVQREGDGLISWSEADARALRDELDKLFPRLVSVAVKPGQGPKK